MPPIINRRRRAVRRIAPSAIDRRRADGRRIAGVGDWTLDLVTGRLTWSDEVFRLFEIDPAQFSATYDDFLKVVHPDDRRAVHRAYTVSLANRQPYEITHRLLMRDGRIKWLHEKCETQFSADGHPLRSHGLVLDVTDQRLALAALQESEARFRNLLETTLDGFWRIDVEGRLLEVNPAYCRMSGYRRQELLGMRISDVEAVESAADTAAHIQYLIANGSDQFESVHRRKDGSLLHVEVSATYREAAGGQLLAFIRDITDRKQAEVDLRIAAATFESQEGMLVTDAQGRVLRVNQAFTDLTGYRPEEIVGKTPRLLKSGRHDTEFYRGMWDDLSRTGRWQGEIWDRRKNGEVYPKWLTISAVYDDRGAISHYVSVHSDITERKLAEDQVRRLAFYDPLTALPNRRLFQDRLAQALAGCQRSGCHGALVFIDLDNFKPINDQHGHDLGDQLLLSAARRLKSCVRQIDTVARFGGDEFVVILNDLSTNRAEAAAEAGAVAEKFRASLSEPYRLMPRENDTAGALLEHCCTASLGVALFNDHDAHQDDILKRADRAMYRAKESGGNGIRGYGATA